MRNHRSALSRLLAVWALLLPAFAAFQGRPAEAANGKGELELKAIDKTTGQPLPVRIHLKDQRGKAVKVPGQPFWHDHFVFDGSITLSLPPGNYTFEMERGPEYKIRTGYFSLDRNAQDTQTVEMERFVDMKKERWWSGDLHIHRPPAEIELLMRADDLHVGPVITWWNDKSLWEKTPRPVDPLVRFDDNRFYHLLAGEDEREGGALLYFNLPEPLPLAGAKREYPSPVKFLQTALAAEAPNRHVDLEKPFWWDMPVWLAVGGTQSLGLAHNHLHREGVLGNEAWGKPRDGALYPGVHGNARWTQDIYFRLLNCGLRIPPSAGSASGVLPNPVGYNRVYVYCDGEFTWDAWWKGLREGKVVVTNGPLLRPKVNGQPPGHVFQAEKGETVELSVALNLATREKIEYLEVIQDGVVVHEVRLDQWAKAGGKLPSVKFTRSGWMLVRAVTNATKTYRFAMTGPYYVEIGYERRVSKKAAEFFSEWVMERALRLKFDSPEERAEVIEHHRTARDYWKKLVETANAE